MENRDEISGDEVNRVEELENIVRKFKFVTAGDGKVAGGFGKLFVPPEELSLDQRLTNLENVTNSFSLSGENVNIAGNFDDGFIFS